MNLNIFNYSLPKSSIAQLPKNNRSKSRLLIIERKSGKLIDENFYNIHKYLSKNDLLVVNDTKVIPARIFGHRKKTKGKVEIFVERILSDQSCLCQLKSTRKLYPDDIITIKDDIDIVIKTNDGSLSCVEVINSTIKELLKKYGRIPLPPYINREPSKVDNEYYQTIFAKQNGSVAAPTAALHFDNKVLKNIKNKGINISNVTLHIGMGTFSTIKEEDINNHKMHSELYTVPKKTFELIKECKEKKGKVIAVGTTVARALESFYSTGSDTDKFYETDIYIKPGYKFKIIDHLVTNFHLPKSSLLIMVSAFYNTKNIIDAYNHAISKNYKFFSYGDSTLIL